MYDVCLLQARTELGLEERLSTEGSLVYLDQIKPTDRGQFKITDILGFTVSSIYLELQRKDGTVETLNKQSVYIVMAAVKGWY